MSSNINGTVIALDVGEKRIGVARINSVARLSEPLEVIEMSAESIMRIKYVIEENGADAVVVGLPRGLDGQETAQTKYSRDFAEELKNNLQEDVFIIDEAGTSKAADERIANQKSAASRDSVAAAIIAEDFIMQKNQQQLKI